MQGLGKNTLYDTVKEKVSGFPWVGKCQQSSQKATADKNPKECRYKDKMASRTKTVPRIRERFLKNVG
jgi:hypothetical protein